MTKGDRMKGEIKKTGKIIDELLTFFLFKEINTIDIKIQNFTDKVKIKFIVDKLTPDLKDLLDQTLNQSRDAQMEEYAWGLIGENEYAVELNLLGMCIDKYEINEVSNQVVIEIERNFDI